MDDRLPEVVIAGLATLVHPNDRFRSSVVRDPIRAIDGQIVHVQGLSNTRLRPAARLHHVSNEAIRISSDAFRVIDETPLELAPGIGKPRCVLTRKRMNMQTFESPQTGLEFRFGSIDVPELTSGPVVFRTKTTPQPLFMAQTQGPERGKNRDDQECQP